MKKPIATCLSITFAALALSTIHAEYATDSTLESQQEYSQDDHKKRGKHGGKRLKRALAKIQLNDIQQADIDAIFANYTPLIENAADREQKRALKDEMKNAINQVLTPEQATELEAMKKKRGGKKKSKKEQSE